MRRDIFEPEHDDFRESFRRFVAEEIAPHNEEWERDGIVAARGVRQGRPRRASWRWRSPRSTAAAGVDDFRFNLVIGEEVAARRRRRLRASGSRCTTTSACPYFLDVLHRRAAASAGCPGIASGELITAIAMTEPGIGSDLAGDDARRAIRDGDHYVVNGSKTFITNGINADLVITAVKTDPTQRHRGHVSLLVVERGMDGLRARPQPREDRPCTRRTPPSCSSTTSRVPVENLLGEEGEGFRYLVSNLPQERLSIAVAGGRRGARPRSTGRSSTCKERTGVRPADRRRSRTRRFALAEMRDRDRDRARRSSTAASMALNAGELTAEEAAMAKWWCTELQGRVVDRCVQLHGGYGYMLEYPIARAYADARVTRIYGGTTEIMKEIIGRSMGL